MTSTDEACSMQVIEFCRDMNRKAARQYVALGIRAEDIAIAAAYSAADLAQHHTGDPASAIAWLRRALDVMEEGLPLNVETLQ
ncbi:hypothetical protein [uncultured Sphingomonas sp.]|uniref:hypothetical protein n=1 Tax=unclassified Sphingomonas TaxID=196159 RepID=UPI0025CE05A7|nr:hypothetical protein [uncultured Sphingomonas sp.]